MLSHCYIGSAIKFFFQLVRISWMVTLSSCLIWQRISFILPPNEYGCVYDWRTLGSGPAIDLQKLPKSILSDVAHFDFGGYVNKQNCHIWGTENPHAYIEKLTHSKRVTDWCGFCPYVKILILIYCLVYNLQLPTFRGLWICYNCSHRP